MNKIKLGCSIIFLLFTIMLIGSCASGGDDKKPVKQEQQVKKEVKQEEPPKTPEQIEKEKHDKWVSSQFHPWDGSHIRLEKIIKDAMNDEDSYKHIKTVYRIENNDVIVKTIFSGKNKLGGTVKSYVLARIYYNDNHIEVLEQGTI